MESRPKKKSRRSNLIVASCIVSCFSFAYGFSNQNPLFQWMIPVAVPLLAAAWAFWASRAPQSEGGENA
jgi:hypothetical protein